MAEESNGNQKKVQEVIERVTGESAKAIAVPSELIHFMGQMNPRGKTQRAVFLSQLIYWSDKGKRSDKFIYKTQREWQEETGLSPRQISSYTKELELEGFIETKLKKANGNPTVHYKVNMNYFLERFENFLENRIYSNRENQCEVFDDSITENTSQITNKDISLSLCATRTVSDKEEKAGKERQEVMPSILYFHCNTASNKVIEGFNLGEEVLLPLNFTPNWDKQFRAVMEFPDISPSYVTKKFTDTYGSSDEKKTLFQWNNKWWNWIEREIPKRFINTEEFDNEHNNIYSKVVNKVLGLPEHLKLKVFQPERFYSFLEGAFSKQTIDDCLEYAVNSNRFACVGNYYFDLEKYKESLEWKNAVDSKLQELGLSFDMQENEADTVS